MLSLVILAAGWGSRYGGLKQVDGFGPSGESLLDYSVYDAYLAGIRDFVFIIKPELVHIFDKKFQTPLYQSLDCRYQVQGMEDAPFPLPKTRNKPWGTAHAVYSARKLVKNPFIVINADDFYGRKSFQTLSNFLLQKKPQLFAMIGFHLRNTLSMHGGVSRGICVCDGDFLKQIAESTEIRLDGQGKIQDQEKRDYEGGEFVSMNCWAFTPDLFSILEQEFLLFGKEKEGMENREFMLPKVVQKAMEMGFRVQVFESQEQSFGVTFPEDKPLVMKTLQDFLKIYPNPLQLKDIFHEENKKAPHGDKSRLRS